MSVIAYRGLARQSPQTNLRLHPGLLPNAQPPSFRELLPPSGLIPLEPRRRQSSPPHRVWSSAPPSLVYRLSPEPAPSTPAAPSFAPAGSSPAWSHQLAAQAPLTASHPHPAATASSPTQTENHRSHAAPAGLSRQPYALVMPPLSFARRCADFPSSLVNLLDHFRSGMIYFKSYSQ
jgi:hypothetical protein